jgi:hypothetical protein
VVGVEHAIMAHDHDAIRGDSAVELERRDAERERMRKTGQRVLGEPARAAVALEVERDGGSRARFRGRDRRAGAGQREHADYKHCPDFHSDSRRFSRAPRARVRSTTPAYQINGRTA